MPLSKDSADDNSLLFPKGPANTPSTPLTAGSNKFPAPQIGTRAASAAHTSLPADAGKMPFPPDLSDASVPLDSANPIYEPVLTKDEMAEISTRKMRILLPSETARRARASMAEIATKKMTVTLPASKNGVTVEPALDRPAHPAKEAWLHWYSALKKILPVYVAVHLALFVISCLSFLYNNHDFALVIRPVSLLWTQWRHWDTGNYIQIALHGYEKLQQMAFFPLYPLLERGVMTFTGDAFTAGLIVSNVAELVMFTVLYRLIEHEFGVERAFHTVLYFAIFPTAFFFSLGYTESTFLCFSLLTFYQIQRGRWWLAALFGFLASLTRADGVFLVIPFCYEYLRQKWPQDVTSLGAFLTPKQIFALLKSIRLDILIAFCIPLGIVCLMVYGHDTYGDLLAFVHAHEYWNRSVTIPGYNILAALRAIRDHGLISFTGMRTLTDLLPDALIGLLLLLCFIGKWRMPPRLWGYVLYALVIYIYLQIFIKSGTFPLESMSRFMLELFPAFILLSNIRRNRLLHFSYLMASLALFFFLASQFAAGHWVL